jgi:hypothetical protein
MGDGTAVSKTGADLLGNRRFESISLQRGVSNEPSADDLPEARPTAETAYIAKPSTRMLRYCRATGAQQYIAIEANHRRSRLARIVAAEVRSANRSS